MSCATGVSERGYLRVKFSTRSFLKPRVLTANTLAKAIGRPHNRITEKAERVHMELSRLRFRLADGTGCGRISTMRTTIDHAGRLVIPKDIRRESGIKPGMPLEVRWEKGAIAITPAPLEVKLQRKGRLLVAVPAKETSRLSADTVERTRNRLRKERSGDSV